MRSPRTSPTRLLTTAVLALASAVLLPATPAMAEPAAVPGGTPQWISTKGYFHEIELDWEPVPGASMYDVFRATGRGTPTHYNTVFESEFVDIFAEPGNSYTYQVAARNAEGTGPKSVARLVKAPIQTVLFGRWFPDDTPSGNPGFHDLSEVPGEAESTAFPRSLPTGPADHPAVSPDGELLAYTAIDGDTDYGVEVARFDGDAWPIQVADRATSPEWAPDGKKLLFETFEPATRLWWIPWTGSPAAPVAYPGSAGCADASWLPDGSGVVATCYVDDVRRLYRITTTGARTAIPNTRGAWNPAVSPDGTAIAYIDPSSSVDRLRLITFGGGLIRMLASAPTMIGTTWSPNAARVYYRTDQGIMTVRRTAGPPTRMLSEVPDVTGYFRGLAVRRADDTAPWVTVTSHLPQLTTGDTVTLRWRGLDSQSGVLRYQTRFRRASWNGVHGVWSRPSSTTATKRTWSLPKGGELCVQVRGIDRAGNVSGWAPQRCQARFLDDPALTRKGGWSTYSSRALYGGTTSSTGKHGATLGLSGAVATRVALLVSKGPRGGKVDVYWGATKIASAVSLFASTTRHRQVLQLPAFSGRRSGTLRIIKTDPNPRTLVRIDGVALRGH